MESTRFTALPTFLKGTDYHAGPGTTIDCTSRASRNSRATGSISHTTLSEWNEFNASIMYPIVNKTNGIVPEGNPTNLGDKSFNATDYPSDSHIIQDFIIDPGDDFKSWVSERSVKWYTTDKRNSNHTVTL